MDRMPFDKSDAVVLLQRTFEASSLTIAPILFNEAANALSIPTQCKKNHSKASFSLWIFFFYNCDSQHQGWDLSHKWNKSCLTANLILLTGSFRKCLKVYGSLYIVSWTPSTLFFHYHYSNVIRDLVASLKTLKLCALLKYELIFYAL